MNSELCILCNMIIMRTNFMNQDGTECSITNHVKCRKYFEQRERLDQQISILQNDMIELDFKIHNHVNKMKNTMG